MILASQNVQIAEEKDFVREKISGIFFVNAPQKQSKEYTRRGWRPLALCPKVCYNKTGKAVAL